MIKLITLICLLITVQAHAFGFELNFGFGSGGTPASSITDLFNGFNRVTGDAYTGGPTVVPDNLGVLIAAGVNRMGVTGGRFADNVWNPTNAAGEQLFTAQSIRTRKGTVAKYDSTYLGFLNEPARTNLFLNSAAPITQNVTTTAQAYTISVIGSGSITVAGTIIGVATEAAPLTATATAGTLICTPAGTLTHGQVEAGAFKTSPITTAGITVTRVATNYTRPTAGVLRPNDWGVWGRVVPSATAQHPAMLWAAYVDANNDTNLYLTAADGVGFRKKIAAVSTDLFGTYTHLAGVPFEYQIYQSATAGMGLRVKQDGGAWGAWQLNATAAGKVAMPLPAAYSIGSRGGNTHATAGIPFTAIIQHSDPKAELERLAVRYP